jgi:hypothetical protein
MAYCGWKLTEKSRAKLVAHLPARHPEVILHHITEELKQYVPRAIKAKVIGYVTDDRVDCFIVEVNGSSIRCDKQIYHITYSVDRAAGGKPHMSNQITANIGRVTFAPIKIKVVPFYVDGHGVEHYGLSILNRIRQSVQRWWGRS